LTRSEFDILHRLMQRPGRVFTRTQLIEQALGPRSDGLDRTIDTHVWSLRRKLGERPGHPRLILSEPGVGYRLNDAGED
jgi:DNA-binding response OmpR family regulator